MMKAPWQIPKAKGGRQFTPGLKKGVRFHSSLLVLSLLVM